jgi:DNA-binding response OmpR family regulator
VRGVIVLADDDRSMREALAAALEANGFLVFEAATGREALELAAAQTPDAVVSDVYMPDGSGLDVAREVAKGSRKVPVILVSGHAEPAIHAAAIAAGASAYLPKPLGVVELMAALRSALNGHHG